MGWSTHGPQDFDDLHNSFFTVGALIRNNIEALPDHFFPVGFFGFFPGVQFKVFAPLVELFELIARGEDTVVPYARKSGRKNVLAEASQKLNDAELYDFLHFTLVRWDKLVQLKRHLRQFAKRV